MSPSNAAEGLVWKTDDKGYKTFCDLGFTYDAYPNGKLVVYWQREDDSVCQVETECFDQKAACELAESHDKILLTALRSREEVSRMLYESLRKHHDWAMDHDDGNYTSPACVSYQETVSALLAYAQANDQVKQPMG